MRIQSMGIRSDSIAIVYKDGEQELLVKCFFPSCNLYHAPDLAICPTTGKPIDEEIGRQKEQREREARASRAEEGYKKRLKALKYQWRGWLGGWGAVAITLFLVVVAPDRIEFGSAAIIAFCWAILWIAWQSAINSRIEKEAREVGASVLKGGLLNSQTIGDYLKKV